MTAQAKCLAPVSIKAAVCPGTDDLGAAKCPTPISICLQTFPWLIARGDRFAQDSGCLAADTPLSQVCRRVTGATRCEAHDETRPDFPSARRRGLRQRLEQIRWMACDAQRTRTGSVGVRARFRSDTWDSRARSLAGACVPRRETRRPVVAPWVPAPFTERGSHHPLESHTCGGPRNAGVSTGR